MRVNYNFLGGLLIGAAVGAALVMFLESDEGKDLVKDLKDVADKTGEELDTAVNDLLKKGKSFVDDLGGPAPLKGG